MATYHDEIRAATRNHSQDRSEGRLMRRLRSAIHARSNPIRIRPAISHSSSHLVEGEVRTGSPYLLRFVYHVQIPSAYRLQKSCMVFFTLIGVCNRERRNGFVERIALAQVAADQSRLTRAGMCARQSKTAHFGVLDHVGQIEQLDHDFNLHVFELADIKVPAALSLRPSKKEIAGGLHQQAAPYNPLAMVRINTLPGIRLENRGTRLLDLQEQRIIITCHQQHYPAKSANAANANHLDRQVFDLKAVE